MAQVARMRVGYLGPEGTFSEAALLASAAPDGVEPVPLASIHEVVVGVRAGDVEWAIVPIENSLDGSISVTLDLLAEEAGNLEIVAEALLRVSHALIGCAPVSLAEIDTVISHPQVPGQCERFLRSELAHARILPAASTAEAVRIVVGEARREQAALGTPLAAQIYGGTVLRESVQDSEDNETRFVWLGRAGAAQHPPVTGALAGERKTSLVFWGPGAERAGWLVRCLDEFAQREINLTKIESRPRRRRLGSYMFFADIGGDAAEAAVSEAIDGLRARCEQVLVLGSYAAARKPAARSGGSGAGEGGRSGLAPARLRR